MLTSVLVMRCELALCVAMALVLPAARPALAADWPNWRGPNDNGSISTGNFPTAWTTNSVAWKYALPGKGSSTPIIWKDRIYLTTPDSGQDAVLALDLQGHKLWLTRLGEASPAKQRQLGSSCNASPVTDGKGIIAYFRSCCLAALELDGAIRWTNDLDTRFGPDHLFWDQGTSPVVTDAHVILCRMHHGDSWIAGFDKATGALRWQQKRNYEVPTEADNSYTTPLFFQYHGRQAILVWGADHLTAHSAADGSLLWTCGGFNPAAMEYWPAIASPVIYSNLAIVPAGRDDRPKQSRMHAIRLDGSGDVTSTNRVWQREDVGVFVCSPAEYQGRVYLLRPKGEIVCLDPLSGLTLWKGSLPATSARYFASPVIANGVLYAAREDGVVFAARVGNKLEVLSENPMGERIISSPAVADGRLLLRGDNHLFCIEAGKH
jgi:outer membrane protein assembly factor BamB